MTHANHQEKYTMLRTLTHVFVLFVAALCMARVAVAQGLSITLTMSPQPSPHLSSWKTRQETVIMTVTNSGRSAVQAKIRCIIRMDGDRVAMTNDSKMPVQSFPVGTTVMLAEKLVPFSAVDFFGSAKNVAIKTGMLPSGMYQLCIRLLNPNNSDLTEERCASFLLTDYQGPILLMPPAETVFRPQERPTFRWTPVTPTPPHAVRYRVQVFEVLAGQRSMQAFKVNQPILDKEVVGLNQLIWPPEYQLPGRVQQYIWTVRALDEQGRPIGAPDRYAEPMGFVVYGCDSVNALGRRVIYGCDSVNALPRNMMAGTLVRPSNGSAPPRSLIVYVISEDSVNTGSRAINGNHVISEDSVNNRRRVTNSSSVISEDSVNYRAGKHHVEDGTTGAGTIPDGRNRGSNKETLPSHQHMDSPDPVSTPGGILLDAKNGHGATRIDTPVQPADTTGSHELAGASMKDPPPPPPGFGNMDDPDPVATPGGILLNARKAVEYGLYTFQPGDPLTVVFAVNPDIYQGSGADESVTDSREMLAITGTVTRSCTPSVAHGSGASGDLIITGSVTKLPQTTNGLWKDHNDSVSGVYSTAKNRDGRIVEATTAQFPLPPGTRIRRSRGGVLLLLWKGGISEIKLGESVEVSFRWLVDGSPDEEHSRLRK